MATNLLNMTEDQFWKSTPKKLQALFKVYKTAHGIEGQSQGCIDDISF